MAKYAELVHKLEMPIQKENGYLYYLKGNAKGDKQIVGIYRSPMKYKQKKKEFDVDEMLT